MLLVINCNVTVTGNPYNQRHAVDRNFSHAGLNPPGQKTLAQFVEHDGEQDYGAEQHLLQVRIDVEQVHRVVEHADQERAKEGADSAAAAPARLVPPTTTAAIDSSNSSPVPVCGEPDEKSAM